MHTVVIIELLTNHQNEIIENNKKLLLEYLPFKMIYAFQ